MSPGGHTCKFTKTNRKTAKPRRRRKNRKTLKNSNPPISPSPARPH
ncbi:hypothetical protein HMPREF9136_2369 [Prevotella dentalis DSM 3688]|uniref:Uncharacterized protein n=1 Tax=Prevotella dentalis (strain ATCC 49559 / DSM 3688 / JCM 13448 / NCTC 12043 / ES 2772) TaxID=908937 RepID=F9D691_PREDD|nr:hypothetical protein HMPREF9136_2369 [Prevotella dentalis DSM 3688]